MKQHKYYKTVGCLCQDRGLPAHWRLPHGIPLCVQKVELSGAGHTVRKHIRQIIRRKLDSGDGAAGNSNGTAFGIVDQKYILRHPHDVNDILRVNHRLTDIHYQVSAERERLAVHSLIKRPVLRLDREPQQDSVIRLELSDTGDGRLVVCQLKLMQEKVCRAVVRPDDFSARDSENDRENQQKKQ